MPRPTERFDGWIGGLGTTSGLRLVVGHWPTSPYGSFTDVLLEQADGHRVLLAPTQQAIRTGCAVTGGRRGGGLRYSAGSEAGPAKAIDEARLAGMRSAEFAEVPGEGVDASITFRELTEVTEHLDRSVVLRRLPGRDHRLDA